MSSNLSQENHNFTHLHGHSEYSLFDGIGKLEDYVKLAAERGHTHFGTTEHGTMRQAYRLHVACKQFGILPIYGIEFYVSNDLRVKSLPQERCDEFLEQAGGKKSVAREFIRAEEMRLEIQSRRHICAYAKNETGLKNLFKLSSIAWIDGYHRRPRIDVPTLLEHKDGIMITSGCSSGIIPDLITAGEIDRAIDTAVMLHSKFGDDFYIEIQPTYIADQIEINLSLVEIGKVLGVNLIATSDFHYMLQDDAEAQEAYLCVSTKDRMSNVDRFKFDARDFWMKTRPEMEQGFDTHHTDIPASVWQTAIDNTTEVAEKCRVDIVVDRFQALLPNVQIPEGERPEFSQWLKDVYGLETGWPSLASIAPDGDCECADEHSDSAIKSVDEMKVGASKMAAKIQRKRVVEN